MGKGKDNIVVSKELQIILEKINKSLENKESLTECGFKVKSLWMFRHVPQIRSFKSWGYLAIDKDVKKAYNDESYRLKERVSKQVIPEDIGSIGKAFKQEKGDLDWLFVPNTYDAPEGTVVELDLRLGHQSVLFVPFKVEKDIVAILLISTATFEEKWKQEIQEIIKETFKNIGINELIQLAYWNERNKDVIANVKKATLNFVGTGTSPVNETITDMISSEITTPEVFVRDHFISPIKEFNQGISFVPIIEIEDKHHLQKPLLGYSDVVYDKLKQRLSESIKSEDYKEGSNDDALVLKFTEKCKKSAKFNINLGQGCSITYVLKGNEDVGKEDMEHDAVCFKEQADGLVNNFCEQCDPKTSLIIKKKYISEKLNQTYKEHGHTPFYLVLEKSVFSLDTFSLDTVTLTFDKELIASNLNDKTFPLDDYREELIGENGFYNFTVKEYQSKLIDGLVFKVYTEDKKRKKEEIFNEDVKAFIDQRCLYYKLLLDQKQAKKDAVRASIAQVMARNMSHNFGSHVLSNLIGDDVYDKLRDVSVKMDLENFERYTSISEWDNDVFKNDGKNRQLPFFFQYLKSRMDYLSEVTFGVSNLLTTKMMRSDVMKELDQVRILLNYISGVSNFKYIFKLQLPDNDIGVAFPSDVLGCQAFYNIIENIIRNTAKHAKYNNGETVTFTITIKDNFAKEAGCEDIEGVDELYCVEIDNGVTEDNIDELVNGKKDESGKIIIKGQNNRLNDSVLEGQNLRSSSLGLLEMEASAAFLRQIDLPEIESDDYTVVLDDKYYHKDSKGKKRLNILKAFAVKENENDTKGHLGYRFFVQKPKEFLFVGNWDVDDMTKKKLFNRGIQIITTDEFCEAMDAEKAFAHQFLIYQEDISEDAKSYLCPNNECTTLLPLRRLFISNEEWETVSKEWPKLTQQDDQQNKSSDEEKKTNGKDILLQLKKWAWDRYNGNSDDIIICGEAFEDLTLLKQIVFLDHGENFKAALNTRKSNMEKGGEVWIENLSSRTSGKLPRFVDLSIGLRKTQLKNYINNIDNIAEIKAEIFEAYHYRVIVLDERIQKFSNENTEGSSKDMTIKIPCSELFKTTDVLIPEMPLDPNSFSKQSIKNLEDFVKNNIKDSFVLVHYGVLERMYGAIDSIDDKLVGWAKDARRVVVTSGRGAHSLKLPKKVCFVNLSSALYAFCENRNKYIINYLLNQSRRKRNE